MKKRKFPNDVARFFNSEKSFNPNSSGIHQKEKDYVRSSIPLYIAGGTARKFIDGLGNVTYK